MPSENSLVRQVWEYAMLRREALRYRKDDHWGASAIEWAIISAVVVGLALLIYTAIKGVVDDKVGEIEKGS